MRLRLEDLVEEFVNSSIMELATIDVSKLGDNGKTLLHLAVEKDNRELFIKLFEAGCELDTLDNGGNHPIHFVQSVAMLNLIIDRHPEGRKLVNRTNQDGLSVLHKVCSLRRPFPIGLFRRMIDLGANVHQLTNAGESAAFFLTNCEALKVLWKLNLELDTVSKDGETALLRHLRNSNESMAYAVLNHVHQLLSYKEHAHKYLEPIFSNIQKFNFEGFPEASKLMFDALFNHSREEASKMFTDACRSATYFIVEMVLNANYDLDYDHQNEHGNTPIVGLLSNMQGPNKHFVQQLLQKAVDLRRRNIMGRDALLALVFWFRAAKCHGHVARTVQVLLDHGAAVNAADRNGDTALHLAFKAEDCELIEVLVRNGADRSARNRYGEIPSQLGSVDVPDLFGSLK